MKLVKKIIKNFMKNDYFKVIRGGLNSTFQDQWKKKLISYWFTF